jgi:hypothetical protein
MALISEVQYAVVNTATSGNNTIVAAQAAGVKIRVVGYLLVAAGAVTANFQSGAGGTTLTGAMSLATGTPNKPGFNPQGWFETAAATLLNLNLGGAVQVSGFVAWVAVS